MKHNLSYLRISSLGIVVASSMCTAAAQVSKPEDLALGKRIQGLAGLEEFVLTTAVKDAASEVIKKQKEALKKELLTNPEMKIYYEVQIYRFLDTPARWSAGPIRVGRGRNAVDALVAFWRRDAYTANPKPTLPGKPETDHSYFLMQDESYFVQVSLEGIKVRTEPINWADCMNIATKKYRSEVRLPQN